MTTAQLIEEFLRHRRATERFAAVMPDEHFGFAPWEGAMPFRSQVFHLTSAANWFLSFIDGEPDRRPETMPQTPAEFRAYLAQNTAAVVARMEALGDLDRVVEFWNQGPAPVWAVLGRLREHEAHHKGQMMQMLRMCGVSDKLFYIVP